MREHSDRIRIEGFMRAFSAEVKDTARVYFSGGVTAVLHHIRPSTIDIDLIFEPDLTEFYQVIRRLKESLNINLEIVAPHHFIPALPGWQERSMFIARIGSVMFSHYDLLSQILSKIQRGYDQDILDAKGFLKLIERPDRIIELMENTRNAYVRFPTVEFEELKIKLEQFLQDEGYY